ncbi:MAG: alpha-amylase family glycosyl hydrolase [bacterium]
MKKHLLLSTLSLFFCLLVSAQVTTEPAFITKGYDGEIKIIFNPSLGNQGMVGATECYAHTGLITENSTSASDWQYATATWRGGEDKYKMTKSGDNWELVISNIYTYYGCPESEDIQQLAFVFNDGPDGSLEGKTENSSDIFVTLVEEGLNVAFTDPTSNLLLTTGTTITFAATASESASLELLINNTSVYTTTGSTLSYQYTFNEIGNYECTVKATSTTTAEANLSICVSGDATEETRPTGLLDGITYDENDDTTVTLAIYTKNNKDEIAENVFVIGDFNDWSYSTDYQMKKDGTTGHFWLTINGLEAGKEYAFQYAVKRADGTIVQIGDAFAEKVLHPDDVYISDEIYPNLMSYPAAGDGYVSILQTGKETYNWSDETLNFTRPDKNNLVIYELWVYDFSSARSINGIIERLDYLENLGVNAIEFMPVSEFEGNMSWGYNPTYYFALDKAYGTSDTFKLLVDEAHKRGIAVIVDMVFNHATGLNAFNKLFDLADNPYFNEVAAHDYNVFEDFNHDFELTASHFVRVLNYWLDEYKIDGYRMDLTHGLCGPECTTTGRLAIIDNFYDNGVIAASSDAYFIMEHWEYSERSSLVNKGMLCWENTNNAYSQTAMGWLTDDNLSTGNKDGYVSYTCSHDEERNFYKAAQWGNGTVGTDETVRLNRVAANVAMCVMLDGPKMFWQFDELGYDFTIGEDDERTESKPLPEDNGFYTHPVRMAQYQKIGQMIQLRTRLAPETFEGNPTSSSLSSGQSQRTIYWGSSDVKVYVASNLSVSETTSFTLPDGTTVWYDYFANNNSAIGNGTSISLSPGEVKIYTSEYFTLPDVPSSYDYLGTGNVEVPGIAGSNFIVYPTVTDGNIYINGENNNYSVNIYNLWGQKIANFNSTQQVNISALVQGFYLMVITTENTQEAFKIYRK